MSRLVYKTAAKVRCDIFPCKELAEYSIGPEGRRQLAFNLCGNHARQVAEELNALLNVPQGAPGEPVEADEAKEEYSCRYCGAKFPKTPEGRSELMRHSKVCPKKPPKE
jgi:hypothetical protein